MENKKTKKTVSDKNIIIAILSVFTAVIMLYVGIDAYYDRTGTLRTEYTNIVSDHKKIIAKGFVVRSESDEASSKNPYVLMKSKNGIYSPVVSDGESIAKNGVVAYVFSNEDQLAAYNESIALQQRIDLLTDLQDKGNIGCLDVTMLNSEIVSAVRDYVDASDDNNFNEIVKLTDVIDYKITSMQIATGKEFKFNKEISSLKKQKSSALKKIGSKNVVSSPSAGYFSSNVDGFEDMYSFERIAKEGMIPSELDNLLSTEIKPNDSAYGKIISEHTWYFAFNMDFLTSSSLKDGMLLNVDFPKAGINGLSMKITSITRDGDRVCIVLKCVSMNDKLLSLRKETAEITIGNYTGCKISKKAITSVDNILGVYVYSGNCCYFKPIDILFDNEDYVIAKPLLINEEKNNGGAKDELHTLKAYDKVIVKGRNLYDGKVIG